MHNSSSRVIAIGNAIVDIIAHVDDEFLYSHGLEKSTMRLCTHEEQLKILNDATITATLPGGSAANTVASLASMGIPTGFIGTVGNDLWGRTFMESLQYYGVDALLETIDSEITGTSVILITPDSERTMNTYLGAAGKISSSTFNPSILRDVPIIFVEGYAYDSAQSKQVVNEAVKTSRRYSRKIMFSLSDAGCVHRHRLDFLSLISKVDIVIGNEQEFRALFDISHSDDIYSIIERNLHLCAPLTIITRSENGSILIEDKNLCDYPAFIPENLVDVTGAGDQFAAGVIYGISQGFSSNETMACATELATRIISSVGPRLETSELIDIARRYHR